MGKFEKVLHRVLSGEADANIVFDDLCWLLERLGFDGRISGSHHIYKHANLNRTLNVQPRRDGKAKDYQVGQARLALNILLENEEK